MTAKSKAEKKPAASVAEILAEIQAGRDGKNAAERAEIIKMLDMRDKAATAAKVYFGLASGDNIALELPSLEKDDKVIFKAADYPELLAMIRATKKAKNELGAMLRNAEKLGNVSDERVEELKTLHLTVDLMKEDAKKVARELVRQNGENRVYGSIHFREDKEGNPVIVECGCERCRMMKEMIASEGSGGVHKIIRVSGNALPQELLDLLVGAGGPPLESDEMPEGGLFDNLFGGKKRRGQNGRHRDN